MPTTTFDQVLSQKRATRRLGNVRLRYDGQLLIGQTVPPMDARALVPDGLLAAAAALGVLALVALVLPAFRQTSAWAFGFAGLAALAMWVGARAARRRRGLSFIINFDRHVIRVDRPAHTRIALRSVEVPFAAARVELVADSGRGLGLALWTDSLRELLIGEVPDRDLPALESVARLLTDALVAAPPVPPQPAT